MGAFWLSSCNGTFYQVENCTHSEDVDPVVEDLVIVYVDAALICLVVFGVS